MAWVMLYNDNNPTWPQGQIVKEVKFIKIRLTSVDTQYACDELSNALLNAIRPITGVALEFESRQDNRTLVIVLGCPCCQDHRELYLDNAVIVSPFKGIQNKIQGNRNIHVVDVYPPFRHPGEDGEVKTFSEFLDAFRKTIINALEI